MIRSFIEADGLATVNTLAYDGKGLLDALNEFMGERGKPAFHLGPTLPLEPGTTRFSKKILEEEMAAAPSGIGQKIKDFLDETLKRKGPGSVIYIGFGTYFWYVQLLIASIIMFHLLLNERPTNPDHLWLMLETLAERKTPFVSSYPYSEM
jgi:hypothetical protein